MKFFIKKAFTLAELIISVIIMSVLVVIIFVFVNMNVKQLAENTSRVGATEGALTLEKILGNYLTSGYTTKEIIPTGNQNSLLLKKFDNSEGVIFGIVNFANGSGKLQQNYEYGDNFIGYRELVGSEVTNTGNLINLTFPGDKIFTNLRAKDFKPMYYNNGNLVDLYISIVKTVYLGTGSLVNTEIGTGSFTNDMFIYDFNLTL